MKRSALKCELLLFGTPKMVGQGDGPFVRLTGLWAGKAREVLCLLAGAVPGLVDGAARVADPNQAIAAAELALAGSEFKVVRGQDECNPGWSTLSITEK